MAEPTKRRPKKGTAKTKRLLIVYWLNLLGKHFAHEYSAEELEVTVASLSRENESAIDLAFHRAYEECKFFPHLADIRERLYHGVRFDRPPWDQATRFPAFDHKCPAPKTKVRDTGALRLLLAVSPYEAQHVICPGERFPLRCPNCGAQEPPMMNPFIAKLMDIFPQETKNWNLWQKGHMLCDGCNERLKQEWIEATGVDRDAPTYRRVPQQEITGDQA